MTKISRRQALIGTLAAGATGCSSEYGHETFTSPENAKAGAFAHGVASGDPTATSVIMWTRLAPASPEGTSVVPLRLEIAEDPEFANTVYAVGVEANAAADWTVKHDATGLEPGRSYYFRFLSADSVSRIGRTKTLPSGSVDQARFAVVSCANWQYGFFNGYDHIARNEAFDAVIHLGDYFYEYGHDGYGGEVGKDLGRLHEPAHEVLTLEDYRARHAQYKTDPALQAMHAIHPMICLWDDHEVANNSWEGGSNNHQLDEGDWVARRRAAMQAYYEWMPVRDAEPGRAREALYKSYDWGDLLTLASVETRLTARAVQIELEDYSSEFTSQDDVDAFMKNIVGAEDRYMLGDAQLDYISNAMVRSKSEGKAWRIVANQILMADVRTPDLVPYISEEIIQKVEPVFSGIRDFVENSVFKLPLYLDSWGGYPYARERFYDRMIENEVTDIVVLTGDAHEFWVNDLITDDAKKVGIELGATSITSPTIEAFLGSGTKDYALLTTRENDCVRYYDPQHKGYIDLTFTKDKGKADLIGLDTVTERDYTAFITASFEFKHKQDTVEFTKNKGLGLKERFVY